ncbi:MAG: SDR family NAD(P)-dependent oxidoreductase [Candidatus Scatosoma sp.]
MELKGKKALIVGASRGIGEAIAVAFAKEGADVAIAGRKLETLNAVKEKLSPYGGNARCLEWDVKDVSKADGVMKEAANLLGGLDIVVNNAGVIDRERFLAVGEEAWDTVMDINVKGVYFSCQAAANYFIGNGIKGKIINMASETGFQPSAMPYGLSKWAVVGFSMGMAKRLYKKGVMLSSIAPGPITTDMMGWKDGAPKDFPNCFGTMGSPEEVADLAVFLASDKNKRIIGRPVFVSGGLDW